MKKTHKLFFAIPFDSASKNLYGRVCREIRKRYPTVTTVIGNEEVGPSQEYSNIASFKAQNRELTKQFVAQIRGSDIVIADLTHNNPNVHVELGIALMENKNILRVTGRSVSELGFDIRNLEVRRYDDETQLTEMIIRYLDTFFKIKRLGISKQHGDLYRKQSVPIQLRALTPKVQRARFDVKSICPDNYVMRDGAVRVTFEILQARSPEDWFGVFFRAGASPWMGSHLVYVRQNGAIEVAMYPGPLILEVYSTEQPIKGKQTLLIQFENDQLDVQLGHFHLAPVKLVRQVVGRVLPVAWYADVDVHSAEMICRDTIDWD